MQNPWLSIALEDYEGHMGADNVRQLAALSELFERALDFCNPESVAILGVAGGNGLERIDPAITKKVIGLDINPKYLDVIRERFADLPGLELHQSDLAAKPLDLIPVSMVHAALVFEHTGLGRPLENALRLVAPGGKFSVVLQLPSEAVQDVTPTRFTSMQALRDCFTLVDVAQFRKELEGKGFDLLHDERRSLPGGKALWLGIFALPTHPQTGEKS